MKKWRYLVLGALLITAVAALVWWAPWARPGPVSTERVYSDAQLQALARATSKSGSNTVARLVKALQSPDTRLGKTYSWTLRKLPAWIQGRLPNPNPPVNTNLSNSEIDAIIRRLMERRQMENVPTNYHPRLDLEAPANTGTMEPKP